MGSRLILASTAIVFGLWGLAGCSGDEGPKGSDAMEGRLKKAQEEAIKNPPPDDGKGAKGGGKIGTTAPEPSASPS